MYTNKKNNKSIRKKKKSERRIQMLSFECDYNKGAHKKILERLLETNEEPAKGCLDSEESRWWALKILF